MENKPGKNVPDYILRFYPLFDWLLLEKDNSQNHNSERQTIKLIFVASLLSLQSQGERSQIGLLRVNILCLNGVTFLPVNCSFSELAHIKYDPSCWSSTKQIQ